MYAGFGDEENGVLLANGCYMPKLGLNAEGIENSDIIERAISEVGYRHILNNGTNELNLGDAI